MNTILVTGIGGNVGQGILRNIRAFDPGIRIIGAEMRGVSGGNHLCDQVYKLPPAANEKYISEMGQACDREKVDLIIPSTDIEGYYLSKQREKLPTLAYSPATTNQIFWDKYLTWTEFNKAGIPFAESCLPGEWRSQFSKYIVKPRKGQGSRGLHLNPATLDAFSDDEYMVQRLHQGVEITTSFYVTKARTLHGFITFTRDLQTGFTSVCEVTPKFDAKLSPIINKMISALEIAGSCNIQSIASEDGEIYPFEINGRISGTNSIRSQFGFKDVQYTVEEYLLNKQPSKPNVTYGSAARILMDVIYPGQSLSEPKTKNSKHHMF
jgi:carbamoyl-phosphate synthase large subunit